MALVKQGDKVVETISQDDIQKEWTLAEVTKACSDCSAKIVGMQAEH